MHRRFFTYISRFACHFSRTLALTIKKNLNEIYGIRRPRVQPKIGLWLAGQNCIKMNVADIPFMPICTCMYVIQLDVF